MGHFDWLHSLRQAAANFEFPQNSPLSQSSRRRHERRFSPAPGGDFDKNIVNHVSERLSGLCPVRVSPGNTEVRGEESAG